MPLRPAQLGFVRHYNLYFESKGVYTSFMTKLVEKFDKAAIDFLKKIAFPFARISLFIVFFWFGLLKIINTSPANPLVEQLLNKTLHFIEFSLFLVILGILEMIIGITFLIPKAERLTIFLLIPHMITTFMPLVFLPNVTWQSFLIPTLEGQYIIKNLVIIALAFSIASGLSPLRFDNKKINKVKLL